MAKRKIEIQGLSISLEKIKDDDYILLTDIAKQSESSYPFVLISSWMKNNNTLRFLEQWEKLHNPDFKPDQMVRFKNLAQDNRHLIRPKKYIEATNAIGMIAKAGRYGGTYAHKDIALSFCYWLSPEFQVFLLKKFQQLIEEDFKRKSLEWHITKITDRVEEVRNLLDTIPHQKPIRNRIKDKKG